MTTPISSSSSAGGGISINTGRKSTKSKSETVNYLLLYEAMVRHQDLEYDATHDHIALTVGRIRHLGRPSRSRTPWIGGGNGGGNGGGGLPELVVEEDDDSGPRGMLTYVQMRRCLLRLGYTWNRSLPPPPPTGSGSASSSMGNYYAYDDDVSVSSSNSTSTFLSGGGQTFNSSSSASATTLAARDIIATDAQLIMLLTTLVEMEERCRADRIEARRRGQQQRRGGSNDNHRHVDEGADDDVNDMYNDDVDVEEEDQYSRGLFLPEFIQAYKLIIGGMQSLQTYPIPPRNGDDEATRRKYRMACKSLGLSSPSSSSPRLDDLDDAHGDGDDDAAAMIGELRLRSRERTLGLLRLFGPNSKDLYADDGKPPESAVSAQSAGESPTSRNPPGVPSTPMSQYHGGGRGGKAKQMMTAKDGLMPRLTEEQIRKMVHSKDTALARILEEHESEMNVMATNMEELRSRTIASSRLLKKRRRRARLLAVVGLATAIFGGVAYEYRRRDQVRLEITTGREAERLADMTTISNLRKDVSSLTSKLNDAEATIRYEETRYASILLKHDKLALAHEEMEGKWLLDRRDLERCRSARVELESELSEIRSRNSDVVEEVAWCRERLQKSEMAMLGMERAMKKSRDDMMAMMTSGGGGVHGKGGVLPSVADIAREIDMGMVGGGGKGLAAMDDDGGGNRKDKKDGKHRPVFTEMKYNRSFRNAVILRQIYSAAGGMIVSMLGGAFFPGIARVIGMLFLG